MKKEIDLEKEKKKLKNKIRRDIVFIVLGLIFLALSIFSAYNENKENNKTEDKNIINKDK